MGTPETARMEDLLARADWLRCLAARLMHDPEDLVQDTWLAALRSPPRTDRPVEPWLASVLKNLVRNRWRASRVRDRAAQAGKPSPVEAAIRPDELFERAQMQRVLVELVLDLEEPYRSTILLRYFEDRNSSQIARALGLPAGTVRWRLKEGIDRLRRRLDEQGGSRSAWIALLAPLTEPAGSGALTGPWLTGKGAFLMAMSMSMKSKLGALAALIALILSLAGGVALWRTRSPDENPAAAAESPERRGPSLHLLGGQEAGPPAAAIQGEVNDPAGRPIAGSVVVLSGTVERGLPVTTAATTDRDGRFAFESVRPGKHRVSASAEGFRSEISPILVLEAKAGRRLLLTLRPGGEILEGTVLDEGGGVIAGARVTALIAIAGARLEGEAAKLFLTISDAGGRYRIALPPREYLVSAEASGYAPSETTVAVTRPMRLDLRLHPAARISGRVFERDSRQPIPDAEVLIAPASSRAMGRPASTRTGEGGRFSFDSVAAGQYQLRARRGPLVGIGPVLDLIATQTFEEVPIAMDPGIAVSGRVRDDGGQGVAGVELALADARATSRADGTFRLEGVPPGRQLLSGSPSSEGWKRFSQALTVPPEGLAGVDLVVSRGGILTGRVLEANGQPAEGATLTAELDGWPTLGAESQADGTFRMAGLGVGKLSVGAWHPSLGVARKELGPWSGEGTRAVELRLGAGASITGLVKLDDGSAAAGISVALSGQELGTTYTSLSTSDDGRYLARGLPPGRYTVHARRKAGPSRLSTSTEQPDIRIVTLGPDERREGVDLVLPKGGQTIGGMVTLADGKPAPGTQVLAEREKNGTALKPASYQIAHIATVREDGRFRIEDVESATFTLWALRPGFPEAKVEHVASGSDQVKLQLAAPASLAGVVTRRDGSPFSSFLLGVTPARSPGESPEQEWRRQRDSPNRRAVRDPTGAFEWSGLAAGTYEIRITTSDSGAMHTVTLAAGERKQGLRLVLDSAINATGKVVELESGAPLPDLHLIASLKGQQLHAVTKADGSFAFSGLLPGEEGPVFVAARQGYVSPAKELKIAAGMASVDLGVFRARKAGTPEPGILPL